jgi:hypothetical protein
VILAAGYDLERCHPVAEWLSRRFSGRLTIDRIVFWGGMVPVFLAAMLYVATIDGTGTQIFQLAGSTVLLAMVASQVDAHLARDPEAGDEDLQATDDMLAVLDDLLAEAGGDPPVAVCFFGAETRSAAGADAFFGQRRNPIVGSPALINFVRGAGEGAGPLSTTLVPRVRSSRSRQSCDVRPMRCWPVVGVFGRPRSSGEATGRPTSA